MSPPKFDVVCLCAEWCAACRGFRGALEHLRGPRARIYWVDIENDAALLEGLDIEAFPTLAIVDAEGRVRFTGAIEPSVAVLERLLRAANDLPVNEPPPEWRSVLDALSTLQPLPESMP